MIFVYVNDNHLFAVPSKVFVVFVLFVGWFADETALKLKVQFTGGPDLL